MIVCDYCGRPAEKTLGRAIYPHRADLYSKVFYRCRPCDAYVGCHKDGKPLGRLANRELRRWKSEAHAVFDPLWKSGNMDRHRAYAWLAEKLGLPREKTHIGMFDIDMCKKVIEVMNDA